MKKKISKKLKIDKNQPSIMDYIIADDTNKKMHDVLIQKMERIELEEKKKKERIELEEKKKKERRENNIVNIDNEPILRSEKIYIPYNEQISKFCKLSNNVYIDGNIKMRENFFENQKLKFEHWKKTGNKLKVDYLKYGQLDKMLQGSNDYIKLGGNCSQQTLILLTNNWQSYWESIKDFSKDKSKYLGEPRIPRRRKKNGEFVLTLTNQQCRIETVFDMLSGDNISTTKKINWLIFPDWMKINFEFPNGGLNRIKTRLDDSTNLKEVRIIPKGVGYVVEIIYEKMKIEKVIDEKIELKRDRIIGIDFGKRNVVTIASNIGIKPIAIKGSTILNLNQFYYKNKGKLQRIYESHKLNPKIGTASLVLDENHNRRILDIMHKYSRYIINYCLSNKIGTIIIGYNPEWKQEIKLGRKTNQGFVGIPHYTLYNLIMYKAKESNVQTIEQEESHTSKCSFLDNESIEHKPKYLGNRKGGLFISSNGRKINSDVQGAYNIIKKAVLRLDPVNANVILKTYPTRISDRIVGERLHPIRINPLRPEESGMREFLTS